MLVEMTGTIKAVLLVSLYRQCIALFLIEKHEFE